MKNTLTKLWTKWKSISVILPLLLAFFIILFFPQLISFAFVWEKGKKLCFFWMPYTNHRDHNLKMKSVGGGRTKEITTIWDDARQKVQFFLIHVRVISALNRLAKADLIIVYYIHNYCVKIQKAIKASAIVIKCLFFALCSLCKTGKSRSLHGKVTTCQKWI